MEGASTREPLAIGAPPTLWAVARSVRPSKTLQYQRSQHAGALSRLYSSSTIPHSEQLVIHVANDLPLRERRPTARVKIRDATTAERSSNRNLQPLFVLW